MVQTDGAARHFVMLKRGWLTGLWRSLTGQLFVTDDARPLVERALRETPRLVQLAFGLHDAPVSTYNTDGKCPEWVGAVSFQRFTFTRVDDSSYEARALATLEPGASLRAPSILPRPSSPYPRPTPRSNSPWSSRCTPRRPR